MDVNVLGAYSAERSGSGFKVLGPDGETVLWTMTERMSVILVSLLNPIPFKFS